MADIRLAKPAAGTTQTIPSAPDGRFIFDFPADAATLTRSGDNLVLTFEDGASIQLQGFYTTYSKEEMPSFQVDGVEISGQDFFAALGEDLMPAAGPAAGSSAARGGRYNEYGGSDLLDGIDHLGRLDVGFDGGVQLATDTVEPSPWYEGDGWVDHGVTVTPLDSDAAAEVVTVHEAGLANGTTPGAADAPVSAGGSLIINAPDGVASIVIGNVTVFENGALTGNKVSTDEGTLTVTGATKDADGSWTVNYDYELTGPQEHGPDGSATDASLTGSIDISVTDATGDTDSGKLTVQVHDDVPSISASGTTSLVPGGGAGNLADGEAANFTLGRGGESLEHRFELAGWDGVTMYAAKVTYSGSGDDVQISGIDDSSDYTLKYSPYKGDSNFTSSDWGLTVDAGEHNEEISVIGGNASEAVVFDLGGQLAYGVTIDFGAFYNGEPGATGTTQWDHVSEKALVTFYRDGQIVGSTLVEGNSSDGTFTLNSSDVVLGGFGKVVISAVDNRTPEFPNENSDFTIQGIDFITKRDDPFIVSEGTVTAESGADGFAAAYTGIHAQFDLAGMVKEDSLNEDGTSGTITVLVDGQQTDVTLTLSEGASGDSILTGTAANGEQLFTATLGKDGNWSMEQYEDFRVTDGTGEGSNQFELAFKTEDADGDVASTTVNVPLEVVDQTPATDTSIGNGDDIIVYDSNDYLVSGGSGIDFMVSNDSKLTMEALLSGGKDGKEGPIVDSIEVLLKGEDALSLTSIQELADKYGITLSTNDKGEETLSLDDRWIKQEDGTYDFTGDADLTLETNLTPVDASDPASEAVQQQVFTLEHSNG